ncbi:MAG: LysM peptidoglycan-binding domain-containing protein [Anaerolineae bacterium]|jgi:LysM repeat protein
MRRVLIALGLALFLVVLVSTTAYARPAEWYTVTYHTVKPGETLYSIGRLYGVSPTAIASYNGIANPDYIYSWQVLAIPNAYGWGYHPYQPYRPYHPYYPYRPYRPYHPYYTCTCRWHHTVVAGENLYRISLHYGVSMWHVARCNGLHNVNYVWAGQSLCIP